jgi:hypothetical protein
MGCLCVDCWRNRNTEIGASERLLLLLTDWKYEGFPVACSEPVNCGNVSMLGSGNWLLTERQSACGLLSSRY